MKLQSITLRVKSMEKQLQFYHEALGLTVLKQETKQITLGANNNHPLIVLQLDENVVQKPANAIGLYHLALLVPSREDLAHVIKHIQQQGVRFDGASDHLFSEAFYLTDPEGNGIEIYRDRPRTEWPRSESGELVAASDPIDLEGIMALHDENRKWLGFPEGTVLGHLHLQVSQLLDSGYFYLNVLGFEEITRFHDSALFMSAGGYHHHVAVNTWQARGATLPTEHVTGIVNYSIALSSKNEMDKFISHLQELHVEIQQNEKGFSLLDPNHIRIFFTWSS